MEIIGSRIFSTWKKSLAKLLKDGSVVPTERNGDTVELLNTVLVISKPTMSLDEVFSFDKNRGIDYLNTERVKYWESVSKRLKEFQSGIFKIDQADYAVGKLSENHYNRQAYATIWSPEMDVKSAYPLCITGLFFCIREEKLNMTAILRSNDAWGQALDDIYHLTKIQEDVAKKMSLPIGAYTHIAMSYHIYNVDLIKAHILLGG